MSRKGRHGCLDKDALRMERTIEGELVDVLDYQQNVTAKALAFIEEKGLAEEFFNTLRIPESDKCRT